MERAARGGRKAARRGEKERREEEIEPQTCGREVRKGSGGKSRRVTRDSRGRGQGGRERKEGTQQRGERGGEKQAGPTNRNASPDSPRDSGRVTRFLCETDTGTPLLPTWPALWGHGRRG